MFLCSGARERGGSEVRCVQSWGSFISLEAAQSRLLDVLGAGLSGVNVVSADWAVETAIFRATCEVEGGTHDFRVWISMDYGRV
jgi:hypothetical protein